MTAMRRAAGREAARAACRLGVLVGVGLLLAASSAGAATRTVVFDYNGTDGTDGSPQTWTVPEGVTEATFELLGAAGGAASGGAFPPHPPGGRGAGLVARVALTPGEVLTIVVGGAAPGLGDRRGGYNGGGGSTAEVNLPNIPGGGGGATDVRRGGALLTDRVLVAGGGGGGGGHGFGDGPSGSGGPLGGPGGDSGSPGQPGADLSAAITGGGGGGAGSATAGGAAGQAGSGEVPGAAGMPGAFGTGGSVSDLLASGGGGGGGWYGGGAGGTGATAFASLRGAGAGGGGGGSSHVDPATATLVSLDEGANDGHGRVTITYEVPDPPRQDAPPQPPSPAPPPPPAPATADPPRTSRAPARLTVRQAHIDPHQRRLELTATIDDRATGTITIELHAAGRRHRLTTQVRNGLIRVATRIPRLQAAARTGIVTITYPGNEHTRPHQLRLRIAPRPARLAITHATLHDGHLHVRGTIDRTARGIVHIRVHHANGEQTETIALRAPIRNGRWTIDHHLTPDQAARIATRTSPVDLEASYTGHLQTRLRGQTHTRELLSTP
jgi:hypothetical protein